MAAKRSTKRSVRAFLPGEATTARVMRARVESLARAVVWYRSSLSWLTVPANSVSPGPFSTGRLSPVMAA